MKNILPYFALFFLSVSGLFAQQPAAVYDVGVAVHHVNDSSLIRFPLTVYRTAETPLGGFIVLRYDTDLLEFVGYAGSGDLPIGGSFNAVQWGAESIGISHDIPAGVGNQNDTLFLAYLTFRPLNGSNASGATLRETDFDEDYFVGHLSAVSFIEGVVPPDLELGQSPVSVSVTTFGDCSSGPGASLAITDTGGVPAGITWAGPQNTNGVTGNQLTNLYTVGRYEATVSRPGWLDRTVSFILFDELLNVEFREPYDGQNNLTCSNPNSVVELEWLTSVFGPEEDHSYLWNDGSTDNPLVVTQAGDYATTLTSNVSGCRREKSVTVVREWWPEGDHDDFFEVVPARACLAGGGSGSIMAVFPEAEPEVLPLTFAWSNGETGAEISNLAPGDYRVTVTTAEDCVYTDNVHLNAEDDFVSTITFNTACGENGGAIILSDPPTGSYYLWSTGDTTSVLQSLFPGVYSYVRIDPDSSNCNISDTITIEGYQAQTRFTADCADETLTAYSSSGALTNRTWIWSNGQVDIGTSLSKITAIPGEAYALTVSSGTGCEEIFTDLFPQEYCNEPEIGELIDITISHITMLPDGDTACVDFMYAGLSDSVAVKSLYFGFAFDSTLLNFPELSSEIIPIASASIGYSPFESAFTYYESNFGGEPAFILPPQGVLFTACLTRNAEEGIAVIRPAQINNSWSLKDTDDKRYFSTVEPGSVDLGSTEVWPGDANRSGKVNHFDVLELGLAQLNVGPQREEASLDWFEQNTNSWLGLIPGAFANLAHADADGNGFVDLPDQEALGQNYSQQTNWYNPATSVDIRRSISSIAGTLLCANNEDTLSYATGAYPIPIDLGTAENPAEDVYGLAFSLYYESDDFPLGEAELDLSDSWLGEAEELLFFADHIAEENRVEVGISRTDGTAISGNGPVAILNITIEDLIFLPQTGGVVTVNIENIRLVNDEGDHIPVHHPSRDVHFFAPETIGIPELPDDQSVITYPNPVHDQLRVFQTREETEDRMETINLYRYDGTLLRSLNVRSQSVTDIDVSDLSNGSYYLEIIRQSGVVTRAFVKSQ